MRPLLLAFALAMTGCSKAPLIAIAPAAAMRASHVPTLGVFTADDAGFRTNSHFLDTGTEVVVFDAQFTPGHAKALLAAIRARTASPVTTVVLTHPSPDKFNGAAVFQAAGARVVASEATAAAIPGVHAYKRRYFVEVAKVFTPATYPAEARVDLTFRDRLVLAGGAVTLHRLRHAGVASTHTVATVPGGLVVGDLVHPGVHAWLEGSLATGTPRADLGAWKAALGELRALGGATVHGGRGDPAPLARACREQAAYLDRAEAIARAHVAALPAAKAALAGPDAARHHAAVADAIKRAFPGHGLGFMADYSVYGLLGTLAARG